MTPSKKSLARPQKQRIFIVDDHPVTRAGMASFINHEPDLEICGEAGTSASALAKIESLQPDLAVVDISLNCGATGLDLIKDLACRHPGMRMLVLSTHDEALYAERALRAGAKGYVMKLAPTAQILKAIRKTLAGKIYLSEMMNNRLLDKITQGTAEAPVSEIDKLSDRELEVFRRLGQGRGTRQIAAELHVSISTVESYRAHIKEKLRVTTASELMRRAVEWVHDQAS